MSLSDLVDLLDFQILLSDLVNVFYFQIFLSDLVNVLDFQNFLSDLVNVFKLSNFPVRPSQTLCDKNFLKRGGFINPLFQIEEILLKKGGVINQGGFV